MIKTISYLGLGTMGAGMASNLLKGGYKLTVWNRSAEKCKPFAEKGARAAESPADAIRDADLIIYMLSNDQAVGKAGLLSRTGRWSLRARDTRCSCALPKRSSSCHNRHSNDANTPVARSLAKRGQLKSGAGHSVHGTGSLWPRP